MAKSKWQETYCWECGKHTKQKYLGKSKQSRNDVFSFLKFDLYECSECGKLNKE